MHLVHLLDPGSLDSPTVVVALDSWVDAGSASTTAADRIADDATVVATFEGDLLFDYRARRPTLEIVDGRPAKLTWPELAVRRARVGGRDVLVISGPEPDYRWRELADDVVELAKHVGVVEWISLGAIPAAVPHTRPVPVLGTESRRGLLLGDVRPGPAGTLRVPSAAISVLDLAVAGSGIPALGSLAEEALQLRSRLDAAAAVDDDTRNYVERLEAMVDESRLPTGDELISDIERFLRDRGGTGGTGGAGGSNRPN